MDLQRLKASGNRVGLLRELLRRGLDDEARALALELIQGGEPYEVVDAEGKAYPIFHPEDSDWLYTRRREDRWFRVCGVIVRGVWTLQRARLFTCDVAESVLPLFETAVPEDSRPREAVRVARRYAYRQASDKELEKARSSSWAAVEAAEEAAYWAAAEAAEAASWAAVEVGGSVTWAANGAVTAQKEEDRPAFIRETVERLFLRWSLGEVPEFTGGVRPHGQPVDNF